jgi:hypothetical protein
VDIFVCGAVRKVADFSDWFKKEKEVNNIGI